MNAEAIEAACQICHKPMTIQVEINAMFSLDALAAMATCDACYNARFKRHAPKKQTLPIREGLEVRKPYAD